MSPLGATVYDILRARGALLEPRITYAELAARVRKASRKFAHVTHRSRQLYVALGDVGAECRRLGLPSLPALVVRADTRRPGAAYFEGKCSGRVYPGEEIAAWWREIEAIRSATYPAR
jgi:hypothetical protein